MWMFIAALDIAREVETTQMIINFMSRKTKCNIHIRVWDIDTCYNVDNVVKLVLSEQSQLQKIT